jgi:hypothetical protein
VAGSFGIFFDGVRGGDSLAETPFADHGTIYERDGVIVGFSETFAFTGWTASAAASADIDSPNSLNGWTITPDADGGFSGVQAPGGAPFVGQGYTTSLGTIVFSTFNFSLTSFVEEHPPEIVVPEPSSWIMMLVGFCTLGMALRWTAKASRLRLVPHACGADQWESGCGQSSPMRELI